jgi:hypothetical protein
LSQTVYHSAIRGNIPRRLDYRIERLLRHKRSGRGDAESLIFEGLRGIEWAILELDV